MSMLYNRSSLVASRVSRFIPGFPSLISKRGFYVGLKRPSTYVETEFDKRWRKLSEEDQDTLAAEYNPIQKKDWKALSMEQKKNCKHLPAIGIH